MSDVLVLCTANVARSPLLAARLQLAAQRRQPAAAIEVASAGTDALFGTPAARGSIEVADRWHTSLADHRATPISYVDLTEPALVLVMERRHAREVTSRAPAATATTFTWPELITTLTDRLDPASTSELPAAADPVSARARLEAVAALAHTHRPRRLPRKRAEVADPIHGTQAVYDAMGTRFDAEVEAVADVLFGPLDRA